jgi:hypothetical protein
LRGGGEAGGRRRGGAAARAGGCSDGEWEGEAGRTLSGRRIVVLPRELSASAEGGGSWAEGEGTGADGSGGGEWGLAGGDGGDGIDPHDGSAPREALRPPSSLSASLSASSFASFHGSISASQPSVPLLEGGAGSTASGFHASRAATSAVVQPSAPAPAPAPAPGVPPEVRRLRTLRRAILAARRSHYARLFQLAQLDFVATRARSNAAAMERHVAGLESALRCGRCERAREGGVDGGVIQMSCIERKA